jgi:O-antigen ligase
VRSFPFLLLSVATALALLVVDVRAEASFDAPKRLVAMFGIAAAMVALAFVNEQASRPWTRAQKTIASCAGLALAFILASAWLSPHRAVALDTLRPMLVFAMVPLLCAADDRAWRWMSNAFLTGAGVNAVVSVAQQLQIAQPFQYGAGGGRGNVSAMIGNSGVIGLVAAIAILLLVPRLTRRAYGMWALLALLLATMAINRSFSPFVVLAAGLLVYVPQISKRGPLAAAVLVFTFAASDTIHLIDKALTYRLGPWKAALSMAAERPLLGFGAGTYGAEYARHADPHFANPHLAGSFAQAHNDYLQALAEFGIPATLLLVASLLLLMRSANRDIALLSILFAGAIAALTWFPLQRPETAMILLAAAGRAWRNA